MDTLSLPESDKALLQALRESDQNAFTTIYDVYSTKLYAVALQSIHSEELAREIVQEIFVSLWINRASVEIRQSIRLYLLAAVRYKVFDLIDKDVVMERYKNTILQTAEISTTSVQETIEYEELNNAILHQIDTLPTTTRNIFMLSRIEGLPNSEIAKQFNVTSKAVEYHITKAIKSLRLHLKHVLVLLLFIKSLF